jgi:IgA Peptidase M64.
VADEGNQREFYGPVLRHECGHGFAFLADEYVTHSEEAPENFIDNYNKLYEAYGWYPNVDFTNSPEKVKWSVFLSDDRYKDEVGIFEGGATYLTGAYKPSRESMMNENSEYFNAPSRWAIYKQIMKRSGEEPSFEKFLEYDAINRGKAKAAAKSAPKRKREPSPDTVIIP